MTPVFQNKLKSIFVGVCLAGNLMLKKLEQKLFAEHILYSSSDYD